MIKRMINRNICQKIRLLKYKRQYVIQEINNSDDNKKTKHYDMTLNDNNQPYQSNR